MNEELVPKQTSPAVHEKGAIVATSTLVAGNAALKGGIGIAVKFTVGCAFTVPERIPYLEPQRIPH